MVVPVGSLGDIIAIIEFANNIRKALSSKTGSTKRYRDLLSELNEASAILLFAQDILQDNISYSVPRFHSAIEEAFLEYGSILAQIYSEMEPFVALSRPLGSIPGARSGKMPTLVSGVASDSGGGKGKGNGDDGGSGGGRMLKTFKWRDPFRKLQWAFLKEKPIKEQMELLRKRREMIAWLVQFAQLIGTKNAENMLVSITNARTKNQIHRNPSHEMILLHDMTGNTIPLPMESVMKKQDLDYMLRILFKNSADALKDIVYRGDYEISSESSSESGSEMILREEWALEPGSEINMTALLCRLQTGTESQTRDYICPTCSTDNSDATKSGSGIVCKNIDCGRWFSIAKETRKQSDDASGDNSASNPPSHMGPPRRSIDLFTGPAGNSAHVSQATAPDDDLLRQLRRFRLQLIILEKRKAIKPQDPPSDTSTFEAVQLHPLLTSMRLNFDVTRPIAPNFNPPLSVSALTESATAPPVSQLVIYCQSPPIRSVTIHPTQSFTLAPSVEQDVNGQAISVADVLIAIQSDTNEPLQTDQWTALDIDSKRKVAEAFDRRCRQAAADQNKEVKRVGPTRVDWMVATRCTVLDGLTAMLGDTEGKADQSKNKWGYRLRADRAKAKKYGQETRLLRSGNIW